MSEQEPATASHQRRMQRKKAIVDARIAAADTRRGVLLVFTGNGKGKSTAAFGMVARALGHGQRVGIVQYIKGRFATGEQHFFTRQPSVDYHVMGEGFTWETQDAARDRQAAALAWQRSAAMLADPAYDLVVLDELNIAIKYHMLELEPVLAALQARPAAQHVVITGRAARQDLIELADTVTEMRQIRHAFERGIAAQPGVEL